ncbi:MAG: AmmeMemoRadiSam system protein B [Thermodesulfovibrionales bacterium]|nr:AmmeMemoRadiSam system protein B [Thermodesulfovibrionales bacterium]
MRRSPAVAGQFYHVTVSKLTQQVEKYVDRSAKKEKVIGIVSPHAGLVYSGPVAGAVYSSIDFPETFVLIGPNHTGLGAQMSLMESGEWEIPTGVFQIDEKISSGIALNAPIVTKDTQAHMFEHSLEVQLPFIAYFSKETKIVPIVILSASIEECRMLGEGIAKAVKDTGYSVVVVASSDMSHYVPDDVARQKDGKAIDKILSLDPEGLYEIVMKEKISMCGYLPTTTMLFAAKALGAHSARLVKYSTSADVSGDYERVVGYAGIVLR